MTGNQCATDNDALIAASLAESLANADSDSINNPHPDIHALFVDFDRRFFGGRLCAHGAVEVKWSTRMRLCAGVCHFQRTGRQQAGWCSIRLSEPLLKFRPPEDVRDTLLHEMIHAHLFLSDGEWDREAHGPVRDHY